MRTWFYWIITILILYMFASLFFRALPYLLVIYLIYRLVNYIKTIRHQKEKASVEPEFYYDDEPRQRKQAKVIEIR